MIEEWRPVPGFEDYEISETGKLRRVTCARGARVGRIIKARIDNGYPRYQLRRDGRTHRLYAHQLVATAFHGECPAGLEVAHGNGIRTDNCASNLSWKTHKDNMSDTLRHGTATIGSRHPKSHITENDVKEIDRLHDETKMSLSSIGRLFGLSYQEVWCITSRYYWEHVPRDKPFVGRRSHAK
jgi:hypothetical protein